MRKMRKWYSKGLLSVLALMLIGWSEQVQSQEKYPTRPIDLIVPYSAGGSTDLLGRLTADYLKAKWGVPINVVNKPGGNGVPATVEVVRAAPNGYSLLVDSQGTTSLLEVTVKTLPFAITERTFIAILGSAPHALSIPSTSPFKTLEELIAEIKRNPEKISYGSLGGASAGDYATRQLFKAIGVDVSKTKGIMTTGGSASVTLVAGGHVTFASNSIPSSLPAIKGGTIKPLFVTMDTRHPDLPDVPTAKEAGYPTVTAKHWVGISGPPKLPSHIVERWEKSLFEMMQDPEFISKVKKIGVWPFYHNAEASRELIIKEIEEMKQLF